MFLAIKTIPEERTHRILDEIDRAERIFRKMCDSGEFEEELSRAAKAKPAATALRRLFR